MQGVGIIKEQTPVVGGFGSPFSSAAGFDSSLTAPEAPLVAAGATAASEVSRMVHLGTFRTFPEVRSTRGFSGAR